jgi:phenylacetate-CoA ligase
MDLQIMLKLMTRLGQFRKHERWTREQLEAYQAQRLRSLREYAYARSPFYQQFHQGLADRPLKDLPVLTKAMVMEHFDELVTDRSVRLQDVRTHMATDREGNRFLNRYWVTATSGSTGKPGIFLFNRDEWAVVLATGGRVDEWIAGLLTPTHRIKTATVASVVSHTSGSLWHMSAQVNKTLEGWLAKVWMPLLSLDAAQLLPEIVAPLNAWQPEYLGGYASMLRILAGEQLAGRLHIHPRMIASAAEVLTEETRRCVEQAWGHQPFNVYSATENGVLAAEASDHTGLYLFEDNAIVEVVDDQDRPVPPGVYGDKVLITMLSSRTQPLIRYELSDSVRLSPASFGNGRPFRRIESIQGRTEDILHLPGVSGGEVAVHPITFHHVLDSLPVSGWQVAQEADGLRVLLSGTRNGVNDSMLVEALTRALAAQQVVSPRICIQQVAAIPKNATGKAPLIKAYQATKSNTLQRL